MLCLVLSCVVLTFNATGRFGVMTCYESWFPETARLLGYKGAEVVLFPSAGCARIRSISYCQLHLFIRHRMHGKAALYSSNCNCDSN